MEKGSCTHLLSIVALLGLTLAPVFVAADLQQEFLDLHNKARADVGVSPLEWDDKVAAYARDYANKRASDCQALTSGGPYGENLYWGYGDGYTDPQAAVAWWLKAKEHYDEKTGKCSNDHEDCFYYKQLIAKEAVSLGCARVTCGDGNTFIICNYDPPVNN